ncbi:MAG: single-stranded-DNA-specific exonuclease RecJ [Anaerolineales bacterium]
MTRRTWILPDPIAEADLERLGDHPPLHAQILFRRGHRSPQAVARFLAPGAAPDIGDTSLQGMAAAVDRLLAARRTGEGVVIFGDYDADGVTATAILLDVLQGLGWNASHYIPNRFHEGYGLSEAALREVAATRAGLVVTVDCGIRSLAEVAWAQARGLDVIVTDHHQPGEELPPARAVINPRRRDETYRFLDLAGSGVAYKLGQAVCRAVGQPDPHDALDLVAMGTIADLAPLVGENRDLVAEGLIRTNRKARPGIAALAAASGLRPGAVTASTIGFALGPRLNAAGRLLSADLALSLLRAKTTSEAEPHARTLDDLNRERQRLTQVTLEQAREMIVREGELPPVLIAGSADFPEGVVGLAAARLVEEFHRPAIVATIGETVIRGSARSIPEFPITEALDACRGYLLRYGGHATAAGFAIEKDRWRAFQEALQDKARVAFGGGMPVPVLHVDAVAGPDDLREDLMRFLERLEPCGNGNPHPLFLLRDA